MNKENFTYIGTISNEFGIKGAFKLIDVPEEIKGVKPDIEALIGFSINFSSECKLARYTKKGKQAVVEFAEKFKVEDVVKKGLFIDKSNILLKKEKYLVNDLIDCKVIDINNGQLIGELIDIWYMPANDVWVVKTPKGDLPIPVIEQVVKEVNVLEKVIKINVINGLMELLDKGSIEDED